MKSYVEQQIFVLVVHIVECTHVYFDGVAHGRDTQSSQVVLPQLQQQRTCDVIAREQVRVVGQLHAVAAILSELHHPLRHVNIPPRVDVM